MKAVSIRRFGGSDVLELSERPRPKPRPGDVLIAAHAAGVNPRDWLIRSGRYPFRALLPPFPLVLGSDVSGVVAELGARVAEFEVGDAVCAMQPTSRGFGTYAEYVAVPARAVALKPAALSHEQAAGLPLAGLTARRALIDVTGLREGQHVLIIGASGGVGSFAVQIAAALGARVTGVCSHRNIEFVRELGAGKVIDYQAGPFLDGDPSHDGYDVIFDTIGKESLRRAAAVLTSTGHYVTTIPRPPMFREALASRLASLFSRERQRSDVVLVRSRGRELAELTRLAENGKLRTHVDQVFPLERAAAAHDASRTFRTRGKLILKIR